MNETPILHQLLICEKLIIEAGTNNVSLINCHTVRPSETFPTKPMVFALYGLLTNGYGTFRMDVEISSVRTMQQILHRSSPMLFTDRLRASNYAVRLPDGVIFPEPGLYQIDLSANGEWLGTAVLELRQKNGT